MTRGVVAQTLTQTGLPPTVRAVLEAIDDLQGREVLVLDLRTVSDAADYFIIASGTSDAHVRGLADSVVQKVGRKGADPHHAEGIPQGRWVLLDYVDFVVHLFHPETRAFYQLERLWGDAPVVKPGAT